MKKIKFEEMVKALAKDGGEIISGLTPDSAHMLHMAVGIDGEIGELIENHLECKGRENKVEELGDIEFYFQGIVQELEPFINEPNEKITGSIDKLLLELSMYGSQLLDVVKKYSIYEKELNGKDVLNHLYNIRIKLTQLYTIYGISREEAIEANIAKLGKRYSSGSYSNKQAQIRADKNKV